MDLESTKRELHRLIQEVTKDNFLDYYEKFAEAIFNYRDQGGQGKPVYEYLIELADEYGHDDSKDEILLDTTNRLVCFCPPFRYILFPDFDQAANKWKSE